MSSDEVAIRVRDVSKHYLMFNRPEDRLKQMIVPRLQRLAGREPTPFYRDFAALSGVSFDVRRGETVGIVGRNGSGKSTLLQIVCGTLRPNMGTVEVNGRIAALLELGAGFNSEFTGRENVYLNAAILGLSRAEVDARFDDIARFADIGMFLDQPVKTYSSGMYVRLAFATAINVDPDILVVDEALAVGDEAFQRKCFARIEDIKDKGGTILFVSHGAQTIVQLCDRALLFDGGELILDGRPKTVVSQYQRLVNASAQAADDTRTGIIAMHETSATSEEAPRIAVPDIELTDSPEAIPPSPTLSMRPSIFDFYDPGLRPDSTVHLEERGARIRDVRVTTLHGERVNVLQMGKRYVCEYWVDFSEDATNLGFGMFVRTVEGLGLAGAQTMKSKSLRTASVRAGECVHIRAEFSCLMLPGPYFITCGVYGSTSAPEILMHRILDAVMIQVQPEYDLIAIGRFDLGVSYQINVTHSHATGHK